MGKEGMESRLIGTVARCNMCNQSKNWLGKYSPVPKINAGKLWLVQHLNSMSLTESDQKYISEVISGIKGNVVVGHTY